MDITEFARKGGQARAAKLTKKRRKEIAVAAITARWAKTKGKVLTLRSVK